MEDNYYTRDKGKPKKVLSSFQIIRRFGHFTH
jgi:hypothetical protein